MGFNVILSKHGFLHRKMHLRYMDNIKNLMGFNVILRKHGFLCRKMYWKCMGNISRIRGVSTSE